ncbi:MAG TPA: metalloregulator ArsR/SmtB family transcription factor [Alphaproteobacteria bacterium]|nr:metalloregulator ArsR/SmtB family transcription factor [Alphaproteobacteria bacterium]
MELKTVVAALAALGHETRLSVFRLLVQAGPSGLAAGRLAATLALPGATLSFHLSHLVQAGLVRATRHGRSIVYAADLGAMDRLMTDLGEIGRANTSAAHPDSATDTEAETGSGPDDATAALMSARWDGAAGRSG